MIADIDKRKITKEGRKTCAERRKTCAERRKITLLKDVKIRKRFEENVIELVYVGSPNLWGNFKDGI